jgi:hypothetical protein
VKCFGIWRWKIKTLVDKPKLTRTVVDKAVANFQDVAAGQPPPLSKTTPQTPPSQEDDLPGYGDPQVRASRR